MAKNLKIPNWSRDEIIIVLDFYHSNSRSIPQKTSTEIIELSDLLRKLHAKLGGEIIENIRSPNSVHMKLWNLHSFNPIDNIGLKRGSKLDEEIFNEFLNDIPRLNKISSNIRDHIDVKCESLDIDDDEEFESQEGKLLTRFHRYRERNNKIVNKKKNQVLNETGQLKCEGCDFDFAVKYGNRGLGFIECHHIIPISDIKADKLTRLQDLALICSNCHRMIHRRKPWLSIDQLKAIINYG